MKIGNREGTGVPWIAVTVGQEGEQRRGVIPRLPLPPLGHRHQFAQRQTAGVDPDDAGESPDKGPGVST